MVSFAKRLFFSSRLFSFNSTFINSNLKNSTISMKGKFISIRKMLPTSTPNVFSLHLRRFPPSMPSLKLGLMNASGVGMLLAGGFASVVLLDDEEEFKMDASTKRLIPKRIHPQDGNQPLILIGTGVRTISWLFINVYVMGLYIEEKGASELKRLEGWQNMKPSQFLEEDTFVHQLLNTDLEMAIRIEPTRNTNVQHLRDGFTKVLTDKLKREPHTEDEQKEIMDALMAFKALFPISNVAAGQALIFTRTKEGTLRVEFNKNILGDVKNAWLTRRFFEAYLLGKRPISPTAKKDIAEGLSNLVASAA